jgi:hypothetical protein
LNTESIAALVDKELLCIRVHCFDVKFEEYLRKTFYVLKNLAKMNPELLASLAEDQALEFEKHKQNEIGGDFAFRGTPMGNTSTDPELNSAIDFQSIARNYETFYAQYINPSKMIISLGNINSHAMTQSLLEEIITSSGFDKINASVKPAAPLPPSVFSPGVDIQVNENAEEPYNDIVFVWESVPWKHEDSYVFYVLEWLIGKASGFMEGGPGRGMHCMAVGLIGEHPSIDEINTVFKLYKEHGIFGLHYRVLPEGTADCLEIMLEVMASLPETITEEMLNRAKNSQALKVGLNLERQIERSVELVYNVHVSHSS